MAVTWSDLKTMVGRTDTTFDTIIEAAFDEAVVELSDATADAFREIPEEKMDSWTLRVGYANYQARRNASGTGDAQTATDDGVPRVRFARDPLWAIRPELGRYVVPF